MAKIADFNYKTKLFSALFWKYSLKKMYKFEAELANYAIQRI
jgi:hypothetical protein